MLTLAVALLGAMGCAGWGGDRGEPLSTPYVERQVWAVAPLRNESGSLQADGVRFADHPSRRPENPPRLDALPVTRVLSAMESAGLEAVRTPDEAERLRATLGADALVVGSLTAYEPYDPPKLGVAVELYAGPRAVHGTDLVDVRKLSRAPTDGAAKPAAPARRADQPVSAVSGYYDAASPRVRGLLRWYAVNRGVEAGHELNWQLYRISMDRYSEFVSYVIAAKLLEAERWRLTPPEQATGRPARVDGS